VSEQTSYTIDELSEIVGIPIRTIRFYVSEGLLSGPGARGKAATYSEEHLLRLRLIRRLVEERVPLSEIRERLASLTVADLRGLLASEKRRSARLERAKQSPKDYIGVLLDRARARKAPPMTPSIENWVREPDIVRGLFGHHHSVRPEPFPSQTWRHITLEPGIELHIRQDAEGRASEIIQRLLEVAESPAQPTEESDQSEGLE
jgi:DNA-binding transcriptional MerR regulator